MLSSLPPVSRLQAKLNTEQSAAGLGEILCQHAAYCARMLAKGKSYSTDVVMPSFSKQEPDSLRRRWGQRRFSLIGKQVNFGLLALHVQVVAVLALESFCTLARPEMLAHDRLRIHTWSTPHVRLWNGLCHTHSLHSQESMPRATVLGTTWSCSSGTSSMSEKHLPLFMQQTRADGCRQRVSRDGPGGALGCLMVSANNSLSSLAAFSSASFLAWHTPGPNCYDCRSSQRSVARVQMHCISQHNSTGLAPRAQVGHLLGLLGSRIGFHSSANGCRVG